MTKKVFALDTQAGIQRDGTLLDRNFYSDGEWVRFQRNRPRKIQGYSQITQQLAGPSRGIYLDPQGPFNVVFNGYNNGVQSLSINNIGVGSIVTDMTLTGFSANDNNLWQFDSEFDAGGTNLQTLLAHPGQNLNDINNEVNTQVLGGTITGTSLSPIGVFTQVATTITNGSPNVTLSTANALIGAGQTVTGTGIPSSTTVVSIVGTALVLSNNATANGSSITLTFDNNVSVSGGVVVLHPYTFVYGNNGLIKNNSAGNLNDWVSADANETNVSSTKIVKGLTVRGGSNAPSGLFWSLDSLIRVSYTPTTVTTGSVVSTFYWRYDIISSQSSILSSQSVIEYDGIYYWCGVDRFMLYNGVVKEIPNTFNQNYFFDNLNYQQRQKVYASKVPRYGEIWWFYPRGDSTECNDAIIYNIRENTWYDVGEALGSKRSAGYFSQVFAHPINADWDPYPVNGYGSGITNSVGAIINYPTITSAGSGYTDGFYPSVYLTGGSGSGAIANITVSGGLVTVVAMANKGFGYETADTLTDDGSLIGGTGFQIILSATEIQTLVRLYQHEIGYDAIIESQVNAIPSFFETSNLGWVSGGPSQQTPEGANYWLRIERVEPDFVQTGEMTLEVTGRPYAQADDSTTGPYTFDPDTHKIDMKEQRRQLRLKFTSNVAGGNYQMGYILLSADIGDVRGY